MSHLAVLGTRPLLRAALVSLLESLGFERVEEAPTLNALMQRATGDTRPEIILINVSGVGDISRLMEEISSWAPSTKVVFLSTDLDVKLLSSCFAAGASGYLLENLSSEALQKSLTLVSAGEKVFPSELAAVISDFALERDTGSETSADLQGFDLSAREIWILRLLADGQSNKLIASTLHIAESTVKLHLRNILRKLHATNRTQAALWALRRGVVLANTDTSGVPGRTTDTIFDR
jgi:two-component system nitrate/nitrite response regulator NarL